MSTDTTIPQTPRMKEYPQYEDSPSSSSGNSIAEEIALRQEATFVQSKNDSLQLEALGPSLMDVKKGDMKSERVAAYSPFLIPIDPRSTSPLLHPRPDQVYLCTTSSNGFNSPFIMKLYYKLLFFWTSNRSYLLVIISTFFGSLMTLLTKLLEHDGDGMHAFQILFLRMAVSWFVCIGCLYYTKRSEFPLGPKDVRWLLLARGAFGFAGIGGLWTALSELSILVLEYRVLRSSDADE